MEPLLPADKTVMDLPQDLLLFLAFFISCIILFSSIKTLWSRGSLPPGPTPLPLLGNALDVGADIVDSLMKLRKKYGDVFTVHLGSRPVVVVCGYKLVSEIYLDKGDDYLNRGDMPAWDAFYKDSGLVFTANMNKWRDLRRFSLTTLRDFGFGKRSLEDRIHEETQHLVAVLKNSGDTFIDPRQSLSKAFYNVIFSIMFGHRCNYEDKEIATILNCIYETFVTISSPWGQIYEMFPWLMGFIPGPHQKISKLLGDLSQYVDTRVKINQKALDPDDPQDYIDAFLIKMEKEKINQNSEFNMRNLLSCTLQIFFAGVETISTTTTYSLLILMKYPDVLAKVHKEIDDIIGRNRAPTLQDRNRMPYMEAMIHEMQRFTDLIPMGVPRRTTKKVTLNGYTLPKDINIYPMLTTVLKDPNCFKYPTEFNPENFLNEKGEFKRNDAFMPLAAGKRICLGESLVRMELFLFLVTILQNFDLKSPVPVEELDITPNVSGLGNFPKPYKLAFIPR
ncbi:cytochrome P450 2G1-like isoform X2 [Engystomops pustulosus]|uniref:cytochrome P450 2G1-like isoform X2 n=1 Tax=Engystomops pustulosus TaxID=76066 RepID=UPI003AFB0BF5